MTIGEKLLYLGAALWFLVTALYAFDGDRAMAHGSFQTALIITILARQK